MEKLDAAIRQYLSLEASSRKIAAAKGRITKLVNESANEVALWHFWLKYGYALPCDLPWHRGKIDNTYGECLWVDRSIISAGWWCAYKWWPDCQWWYYERHPEWFTDMDWWPAYEEPKPQRFSPIDDPYAAVLGGIR